MSQELITSFKAAHQTILISLQEVQSFSRSYTHVKPKIRDLHAQVLVHFERQGKGFYQQLSHFYSEDREASKMLEFLVHDFKEIKIKYLIFYDRHSGEMADVNARSFPKDFMEFVDALIARIKIEQEYLFPLLNKFSQQH